MGKLISSLSQGLFGGGTTEAVMGFPSVSRSKPGLLGTIGGALKGIFTNPIPNGTDASPFASIPDTSNFIPDNFLLNNYRTMSDK
jgi:hypothetical protein